MQTMNISLPDQLKQFVEEQVASGRYSSVSEYVRELIRGDEKQRVRERLEAMLVEGIESGEPSDMTREDWSEIRSEAARRLKERKDRKLA